MPVTAVRSDKERWRSERASVLRSRLSTQLRRGAALLALLAGVTASTHAQTQSRPAIHDLQAWFLLLGLIPLGEKHLLHAEVQPRWTDDVSRFDQMPLRVGVGRRVGRRPTVWAGYGYLPRFLEGDGGVLHEQRIWEQVSISLPRAGRWAPMLRIRREQRFAEQWDDTSHRIRALGRLVRPVGTTLWSIAISDEYIRRLAPALSVEMGYLWQAFPSSATRPRRHNHAAMVWLMYTPPVR